MSLILDALRKSERTRQQSLTGQLGVAETPAGPGRLPIPWIPVIAVILMLNGVLLFFLWPHGAPSPAALPSAASLPAYHPAVRPLADEASSPDADTSAAAPAPAPVAAANPAPDIGALPTLDALPADLHAALPSLHMDVHGYAVKPSERFVVINLKQYHIGDAIADGLTVKDIVPQGAVLEFRGTTFLLPAE